METDMPDDQIKNSIISTNEILLGSANAKSMAAMYLNLAHAAGMASQNAVSNQQHLNILGAAAVATGASGLLRTGFASQVENLTPAERLDLLQKLLAMTNNNQPAASNGAAPAEDGKATAPADAGKETTDAGKAPAAPAAGDAG
ncbi:MAG: hypothetical protein CMN55_04080 [Sneathiella sp.]|jgi:hypothetical protein|nr:hypothetical protein [Sneathiella sp.]